MPAPKVNGYIWKRKRIQMMNALVEVTQQAEMIRKTGDIQVARERASNIAVQGSKIAALFQEMLAIVETNE